MHDPLKAAKQLHDTIVDLDARSALHANGRITTQEFYQHIEETASAIFDMYQEFVGEKHVREAVLEFSKQYASLQEYVGRILKTEKEIASGSLPLAISDLSALMYDAIKRTARSLKLWLTQFEIQAKLSDIRERRAQQA